MGTLILCAGAGTVLAQDREKAPGDVQAIQTAYVRVYPLSNPPLRTVGFYLGLGKHIPLEAVEGGGCRGKLVYGGKDYPIAVEEAGTDAPRPSSSSAPTACRPRPSASAGRATCRRRCP